MSDNELFPVDGDAIIRRMDIFQAITKERYRQDEKWGEQNHDDYTWLAILTEELGEVAQAILHDEFGGEAAGNVETELTEVATVAIAWLECVARSQERAIVAHAPDNPTLDTEEAEGE